VSPGSAVTGFPPGILNGAQYLSDGVALQAQSDLLTAYNDAAGRPPLATIATELGGKTMMPGVYNSASGTFGITGILTLDAQGDSNGVFIFQMATTIITASISQVVLVRGAQACNVFWQVGSSATLGAHSAFIGNILAYTSINQGDGASMDGRALAQNGAVTLDTDTIATVICANIAPPDSPDSLVIQFLPDQNWIRLDWGRVTHDLNGLPLHVDYYVILRNDSLSDDAGWDSIGVPVPPDTNMFIDPSAYSQSESTFFYQVRAVKN